MSSWIRLPNEILKIILSYLDSKDKAECQLTCRNWAKASQKALYANVAIESTAQIALFIRTIVSSTSRVGNNTRQLFINNVFNSNQEKWDSLNYFTNLVKYCPNLRELKLSNTCSFFWTRILMERYEGNWKHLNTLQYPSSDDEIEHYHYLVLTMRDTIKQLKVCNTLSYTPLALYANQFNVLESRLDEFKQLEQLDFQKISNISLPELVQKLECHTRLKTLNIALYPIEPLPDLPSLEDQETYINKLKKIKNTTRVSLKLLLRSEDTLTYIIKKFPNLVHLKLDAVPHSSFNRLASLNKPVFTIEVLKLFARYLGNMKSFSIKNLQAQNMDQVVHVFQEFLSSNDLCVKHEFEEVFTGVAFNSLTLEYDPNHEPTITIVSRVGANNLNSLTMIKDIGISLSNLQFECPADNLPSFINRNQEVKQQIYGYYLHTIFNCCPNLKSLKIIRSVLMELDPDIVINNSIEALELVSVQYYVPLLYQLSARLPCLKHFTIYNCSIHNEWGKFIDIPSTYNIDMPYSSFETVTIYTDTEQEFDQHFHVRLVTIMEEKYYQCSKSGFTMSNRFIFDKTRNKKQILKIHIRCKSLQNLVVKTHGFNSQYTLDTIRQQ